MRWLATTSVYTQALGSWVPSSTRTSRRPKRAGRSSTRGRRRSWPSLSSNPGAGIDVQVLAIALPSVAMERDDSAIVAREDLAQRGLERPVRLASVPAELPEDGVAAGRSLALDDFPGVCQEEASAKNLVSAARSAALKAAYPRRTTSAFCRAISIGCRSPYRVADFIDLKSPAMGGHSRRCAELATRSAELLGFDDGDTELLRRAALVHELNTTAIPNSILDKPAVVTRAERDRVEAHTLLFEQMARRSRALAELIHSAACHHKRIDESGYHRHLGGDALEAGAKIMAAVAIHVGSTTNPADRAASRRPRSDHAGHRRASVHLPKDSRPPHPARLCEDRRVDSCRSSAVGDAERHHSLALSTLERRPFPSRDRCVLRRSAARSMWSRQVEPTLESEPRTCR